MEKDFTILIVEDDVDVCQRFTQYVNTQEDIEIVAITDDATQAISDILYYEPDAVILDLELHNGTGSGLDVLSSLKGKLVHPFILITTNNCSQIIYEHARELGADYIFYKHQNGYSKKQLLTFYTH